MKKINVIMLAFVLLFVSFGANVAADGSDYFDTVSIDGILCYEVPEALDNNEVSDDTVFYIPVGVYDGYEKVFSVLAAYSETDTGLPEEEGDEITDIFYDIWSNYSYDEACLNEYDAANAKYLWNSAEDAYWNGGADDDPLVIVYNCLPNWAYEMRSACFEITYMLKEVYEFVNGESYYDSIEEIMEYNGEDFLQAVHFVNVYFPELEF